MRKPARVVAAIAAVPYLVGCFAVLPAPIPASPEERRALTLRGVIVGGPDGNGAGDGERVEFGGVENVTWTEDAVSILGIPRSGPGAGELTTRTYPLTSLSALLVRRVEPGRTSALIGATIVLGTAVLAFLVDGFSGQDPPGGRDPQQMQLPGG